MFSLCVLFSVTLAKPLPHKAVSLADLGVVEGKGVLNRLDIDSKLGNEVMILPAQLDEADLRSVATSLHASLTQHGKRWTLSRSPADVAAVREADRQWLTAQVDGLVQRLKARNSTLGNHPERAPWDTYDLAERRRRIGGPNTPPLGTFEAMEITPAARLLTEFLEHLPASARMTATPGSVAWFTSERLERTLPAKVFSSALARYIQETEGLRTWQERTNATTPLPPGFLQIMPQGDSSGPSRSVCVNLNREGPELSATISVFTGEGKREVTCLLSPRPVDQAFSLTADATERKLGRVPLEPSELPAAELWQPNFRDPVENIRPILLAWSQAQGYKKLIACVPDEVAIALPECVSDGTVDLDRVTAILARNDCELLPSGDRLILRPTNALQEEARRLDRRPARQFLSLKQSGNLSYDAVCNLHRAYASTYPTSRLSLSLDHYLKTDLPASLSILMGLPHELLVCLGELNLTERSKLLEGGSIDLAGNRLEPLLGLVAQSFQLKWPNDVPRSDYDRLLGQISDTAKSIRITSIVSGDDYLYQRFDPKTGKPVDASLTSLSGIRMPGLSPEIQNQVYHSYRYKWGTIKVLRVSIALASGAYLDATPIRIERMNPSAPMSFDDIPKPKQLPTPVTGTEVRSGG